MKPTFCLISHGSLFYILLSWQHAVNLLRHLSTAAIGCQHYSNMCQVLFDKVWYLLSESLFVHVCLPRHFSGKNCDSDNQFISEGKCTYVQPVGRSGRQVRKHTVERFHCFQFYKWNAQTWTALYTTSLQYRQQHTWTYVDGWLVNLHSCEPTHKPLYGQAC